jgi:thiamine biosynthesis lipoprotein
LSTSAPRERRGSSGAGHIVDPRTGATVSFAGSVTVAAVEAAAADALSTALCVMGAESGWIWAEGRGVAALFAWRDAAGTLTTRRTGAWNETMVGGGPRP